MFIERINPRRHAGLRAIFENLIERRLGGLILLSVNVGDPAGGGQHFEQVRSGRAARDERCKE
ncbi:MAG: hypothetical protein AAFX08_02190 [Pseudomonadota bacterium]